MGKLKHRIKMGLKGFASRAGTATGAWRLANSRARNGRITILTLHCVGRLEGTEYIPDYMKLPEDRFERLLAVISRCFEVIPLMEALARLASGRQGRNAVALTLDDGYKDNFTRALPLLRKYGVPATVFLEAGAVDRQGLTWIHKFFFVEHAKGERFIGQSYADRTLDASLAKRLRGFLSREGEMEYHLKRILKYEAKRDERDRIFEGLFTECGGDAQSVLDGAYLNWDDVKAMAREGVAFGCHTLTHPILSSLDRAQVRAEVRGARELIRERTGMVADAFAYPWGRAWDFTDETIAVLKEEGFACGLMMDEASAFPGRTDPFRLSRFPVRTELNLSDILAQASGIYGWFGFKG